MRRAEVRWAVTWAVIVVLVTCIPYLYAAPRGRDGTVFSGLICGHGDHCVYLSWAQQVAQGHLLIRNLFTGDEQRGIYLNSFAWMEGTVGRLTGLPLVLVHHGFRCLFAVVLLVLIYRFAALFTEDLATRRAAFWFSALAGGFGWVRFLLSPDAALSPVDQSQAEATTFLSLYSNGLFCAALCLMLGIFLLLLQAEGHTGRTRWGRVLGAGLLGLLLGNIHSYDVITVTGVWIAYLAMRAVEWRGGTAQGALSSRHGDPHRSGAPWQASLVRSLADSVVAGLIALPSTAYQYYLYRIEPVFRMRADSPTLSPPLWDYLLGYGLVLVLAIGGAVVLIQAARRSSAPLGQRLLPLAWAVIGFLLPYLPLAFQRKLVMGLHLPLALLAGFGAAALARALTIQRRRTTRAASRTQPSRAWAQAGILLVLVLLTLPTNWFWVVRDVQIAPMMGFQIPGLPCYIPRTDVEAMRWVGRHVPPDALIFCAEESGTLIPALAGRRVYSGHWSETPHADARRAEAQGFFSNSKASPEERLAFLQERRIRYVYLGTMERSLGSTDLAGSPHFRLVYRHNYAAIYEVLPSATARRPATPEARGHG